ncbi:MAG: hypothetical protein ACQEUN_08020 [Pseudomonadota bacterium]
MRQHPPREPSPWPLTGGITLGLLLAGGLWLLLLAGQMGRPHPNHQWVLEAWAHKQARAEALPAPRLLVAGGSSAMFGIDSSRLEATFARPTVNLGVNAGLGLPVILHQTLTVAGAGDTVVMPLEYPLFGHRGEVNQVMNDYYLGQPEALLQAWQLYREALPGYRWLPLIASEAFQIVMQTSPARVLQGYRGLPEGFRVTGTYGAHRLDGHGDQTQTSREQRAPWMRTQAVAEAPRRYGAEHERDAPGWALLRHFQARLRDRDACLVLVPPAFLSHPAYREDPDERHFYATLPEQAARHGLTYRGAPHDFMYPPDAMFDTDYHLVDEARQRNTRKLIEVLTAEQALESVVECPRTPVEERVAG